MNKGKSKLYSAIFKNKYTGKKRWRGSKGYLMKYGRKKLGCIYITLYLDNP